MLIICYVRNECTANNRHVIGRTSGGTPDQLSFFKSSKSNKSLSINT